MQEQYFFIDLKNLPSEESVFEFNIFLFEPHSNVYTLDLAARSPFTKDVLDRYAELLNKGARLAINYRQKKIFLSSLNLTEEQIPYLKPIANSFEEKRRIRCSNQITEEKFLLGDELRKAIKTNNFESIIERARLEILALPSNFSQTLSNAIQLAEMQMQLDCINTRIVSMCYFMARSLKKDSLEDLGDLLLSAFIYDIGLTQLNLSYQSYPHVKLNSVAKDDYTNHPGLAMHLIRKSKISMSLRAKQIIEDHHEKHDGSGYPRGKQSSHVDKLSQIIGLVDFCFQYSSGHITGNKPLLDEVISNVRNKVAVEGIESGFDPDIVDAFYALCFRNSSNESVEESTVEEVA
jgi:response regulator RpfG family c-di-GMP phosphodiesterase